MKLDIVLAGVGGQGILTIAHLIDSVAIQTGIHFKQAEVHGMSQRGGAVYSHLRLSSTPIFSDLIPEGQADLIVSMEPLEVGRYLTYLKTESGTIIANRVPIKNIPNYPAEADIDKALWELPRVTLLDANALATHIGMPKASNVALVGATIPWLPFTLEQISEGVRGLLGRKGAKVVDGNLAVLKLGYAAGMLAKALTEAQVSSQTCHLVIPRLDPASLTAVDTKTFVSAVKRHDSALRNSVSLKESSGKIPATLEGLARLL